MPVIGSTMRGEVFGVNRVKCVFYNTGIMYFFEGRLMGWQKGVTPVKTGVQKTYYVLKRLDSGFCRNDVKSYILTYCEAGKIVAFAKSPVHPLRQGQDRLRYLRANGRNEP
jgi:hypothetical protein